MSTKTNTKLVEFLTSPENLSGVMEVIRHSDDVRAILLLRFWTTLHAILCSSTPEELKPVQPHWGGNFRAAGIADKSAFLDLHLKSSQTKKQSLFFRIEHWSDAKVHELYFGLHWQEPVSAGSSILAQPKVKEVESQQQKLDFEFDNNPIWHGWKYLNRYTNRDEFLSAFVDDPKVLLDNITDHFWPHVLQTYSLVIQANESIH